ncbi:hypothetical protein FRC08_011123, partial [Ceratobasidium sp. 394]
MEGKAIREIIRGADYSFSLTRLASPIITSQFSPDVEFSLFLEGLDALEELVVLSDPLCEIANDIPIGDINPQFLPRLRSISANLENLMTLIPGRPVSHVSIPHGVLDPSECDTLAATLSRSLVPIDSLDVPSFYYWIYSLLSSSGGLLAAIHRHSVRPKHLAINMTISTEHLKEDLGDWDDLH